MRQARGNARQGSELIAKPHFRLVSVRHVWEERLTHDERLTGCRGGLVQEDTMMVESTRSESYA